MDASITASLPVRPTGDRPALLTPAVSWLSGTLAALAGLTSLLGLTAAWPYAAETENWALQARGQDIGNLIAVAVLVAGLTGARRGSVRGRLAWTGSLFYLAYTLVLYAMTIHFGPLFLSYVACLGLAGYNLILTLTVPTPAIDPPERMVRPASVVLAVIGIGFALLWLSSIVGALVSGRVPAELVQTGLATNPVQVLDLALVLPAMVMTAVKACRGSRHARLLLAPWLVFSALIAASLVAVALLSEAPVALVAGFLALTAISGGTAALVLRKVGRQRDSVPSS